MRCLDASFLVDYLRGNAAAVDRLRTLEDTPERMASPAAAVAELLAGAHNRGRRSLARTLEFVEQLEVLPFDVAKGEEAGRRGTESLRRGTRSSATTCWSRPPPGSTEAFW